MPAVQQSGWQLEEWTLQSRCCLAQKVYKPIVCMAGGPRVDTTIR